MKKQLLFDIRKMSLKIACLAIFALLSTQSIAQKWTVLASGNDLTTSNASASTRIAVVKAGSEFIPYVLFTDGSRGINSIVEVRKRLADGTWQKVGGNLGGTGSSYGDIYSDANDNLYVSYLDFTSVPADRMAVRKYNAANNTWEPLNNDPANLYVSATSALGATHSDIKGMSKGPIAFDSNNNPYIAFSEGGVAYVKKYDSFTNTWGQIGPNPTSSIAGKFFGAVSLLIDETDTPWIAGVMLGTLTGTNGTMDFFKYNAGTSTYNRISGTTTSTAVRETHMALVKTGFNTGKIHIINYIGAGKAVVYNYNKNSSVWGTNVNVSDSYTGYVRINSDISGNLYVCFRDTYGAPTTANPARIKKLLNSSGATWTDLLDPSYTATTGIDGSSVFHSMDLGQSPNPYVVYIPTTGSKQPVVRAYSLISTAAVASITNTSATVSGELSPTADGITERGIVVGATVNPTIDVNTKKITDASSTTGAFTGSITGLSASTTYYARAYFIYSTDGGLTSTTAYGDNILFTTGALGTDSFEKSGVAVNLYPNPTTDIVTVSLQNSAVVEKIAVYNSLGQLMLTGANNTVSLQNLANGIYYLTIYSVEGNYSKKIIKE
jgi:hypothetical protein